MNVVVLGSIQTKWVGMGIKQNIFTICDMEQEEMTANRDHHSSVFQIGDEVKDPTETQYQEDEELEDLVLKESLTRVWMFVQVLAGSEISFHRDINDTKYFALSGDYSRSASQDAQRDAVKKCQFSGRRDKIVMLVASDWSY